jgi:hypothetical protein
MNIKTCRYVGASEIFKGLSLAWEVFCNSNADCTWGDNNRSMVTADVIINAIEKNDMTEAEAIEVEKAYKILDSLDPEVYVDLES